MSAEERRVSAGERRQDSVGGRALAVGERRQQESVGSGRASAGERRMDIIIADISLTIKVKTEVVCFWPKYFSSRQFGVVLELWTIDFPGVSFQRGRYVDNCSLFWFLFALFLMRS